MSTNGATAVTLKTQSSPKLASQLKQLLVLAKEISGREKELENLDQLVSGTNSLQKQIVALSLQLKAKETDIASLQITHSNTIAEFKSAKRVLTEEFGARYTAWAENTHRHKKLEARIQELEEQLTHAREDSYSHKNRLGSAEEQVLKYDRAAQVASKKSATLEAKLQSMERELQGAITQVEQLQASLRQERENWKLESLDIAELNVEFDALAKMCHDLATEFFLVPLPQDQTFDSLWPKLQQSDFIRTMKYKKIPLSSTEASQLLRMAAAESVIVEHLCADIFQQYYLPGHNLGSGKETLDGILNRLYTQSPQREAIFRGQLLSAYTQKEEVDQIARMIDDTKCKISRILLPLLFTQETQDSFQQNLQLFLSEAVRIWRRIQSNKAKGRVNNEPGHDWKEYPEHDQAVKLGRDDQQYATAEGYAVMSLFPQIYVGEDMVCQGHALWSSQNSVIAGIAEYTQLIPPSPTRRRTGSIAHRGTASMEGGARRPLSVDARSPDDFSSNASFSSRVHRREQQQ